MKIYTNTFDLAFPSASRFWVAPNSDFKIGIKIENKGAEYSGSFTLKQNGETLTPDSGTIAGFTTYTIKSLGTGSVIYTVDVADAQQKFTLAQIVTDSTVFDVGGLSGGGDVPADVATQSWVNSQISDFITEDALTGYATKDEITAFVTEDDLTGYATKDELTAKADVSSLTAYAESSSLTAYATKDEITAFVTEDDLTSYATKDELTAKADVSSLTAYATKDELTAKADASSLTAYATISELSNVSLSAQNALSTANGAVKPQSYNGAPATNYIQTVYESDWETLSSNTDANTMYVVIPDVI